MAKITLAGARDIALDRLVASDANVRRIKAGVSIEELADDIAGRGLLQSLSVRPLLGEDGEESGKFAVTAGGRRLAALKLLVKQKRLAKNAPVPCIVKTDGIEEEDSLAENTMRQALHPLDQFRAFKSLHEQGLTIDEIAARFFVAPQVVRQRLKLAAASQKLLDLYVAEELSLDQLSAFCVTDDHARQEQVWEALSRSYNREPYTIRRVLTEGAVRASDKRAIFVGTEAYEAAGIWPS
jgi:ParB family chromosome partitioning protein